MFFFPFVGKASIVQQTAQSFLNICGAQSSSRRLSCLKLKLKNAGERVMHSYRGGSRFPLQYNQLRVSTGPTVSIPVTRGHRLEVVQ